MTYQPTRLSTGYLRIDLSNSFLNIIRCCLSIRYTQCIYKNQYRCTISISANLLLPSNQQIQFYKMNNLVNDLDSLNPLDRFIAIPFKVVKIRNFLHRQWPKLTRSRKMFKVKLHVPQQSGLI